VNQRFTASLVVAATIVGIACVDMAAPKGAASISVLQLPSPSVIVGDSMRDSLGVARPITVIAYDGGGSPIADATAQLFVTDTSKVAHLTTTGVLVGDKIGSTRLLGQVEGLQTPSITVPVTYRPAKIIAGTKPDTVRPTITGDTATERVSSTVRTTVLSALDSASQGIIVRFTLTRQPAASPNATGPVAFLANESNVATTRDTTDASGGASIRVVVYSGRLEASVAVSGRLDSAVVQAQAFHNGKALSGSPVTIVVPIRTR
jgi:hypothetical protein